MQRLLRATSTLSGALGLIAASLMGPLAATRAADAGLRLDNVVFTLGATTYRIPRLELQGAAVSASDLMDMFKGDEKAVDSRLARLSAKSLAIPSMTTERRIGEAVERAVFRELAAEDLSGGRIGRLRVGAVEQTVEKPGGAAQRFQWGASLSKGVDLRQLAHLALAVRQDPGEAMKPVIDEERVDSLLIDDRAGRITVKTGRFSVTSVKGRALPTPPDQLLERVGTLSPDKAADPALLRDLVDAAASFDAGALEIGDVVATGKGGPADKPYTLSIGRLAAKGVARAGVGELGVENFQLLSSDGGRLAFERFSLRDAFFSALLEAPYPFIGHIGLKGFQADVPDARMGEPSRMKFSLADAEADFSDYREIAPTKLSARVDRLAIDLLARGEAPATSQFLALGYHDLDLSGAVAGEWREKTQDAVFAPLRVEGRDMGTLTLNVTFGNVSGAVFSSMAVVSRAAAMAASVRSVELIVEGSGLIDRLLAQDAKAQKVSLEKSRADYAKAAGLALTSLLGGGEKARRIGDAVAAYVERPRRLRVRLSSPAGLSAFAALMRKPGDIIESVDVEAVAER